MMLGFFEQIVAFNLELSLLLILIIALRWLLKKSAKVYNSYWLWLLLPLVPLSSVIVTSIPYLQQAAIVGQFNALRPNISAALDERRLNSINLVNGEQLSESQPEQQAYQSIRANLSSLMPAQVKFTLGGLWLLGVVILLLRLIRQHCALRARLQHASVPIKCSGTPNFELVGIELDDFSPAVYGFFKPKIYFPTSLYSELTAEQRALIIEHEEQHIRQGHLWINLLWDIAVCINWFNPLTYLSRNLFRHDQEVLCDYLVLKKHDEPQQRAYGHALLSTVSATHSVSLLCSWKMFDQLEERIMNIKSKHQKLKLAILVSTMAGALTLSSLYAIAGAKQTNEAEPQTTKKIKVVEVSEGLEKYQPDNRISIVKIDAKSDKSIAIKTNGKTYRLENGKRFIEEDGQARALNQQESKEMDDLLDKSERYRSADRTEKGSIFDQEHVYAYTYDSDKEKIDSTEMIIKILDNIDRERINAERTKAKVALLLNDAEEPQERIRNALRQAKASNDPELRATIRTLEKAQKQIERSRQKILEEQKRVLKQVEKIEGLSTQG